MIRPALACASALTVMSACADPETDAPLALASSAPADASAPAVAEEALQPATHSNDINGLYIHPACNPVYPAAMLQAGAEARCEVNFRINAEGEPVDANANCDVSGLSPATSEHEASEARESFASAAIHSLSCDRFQPDLSGRLYSRSIEFRLE